MNPNAEVPEMKTHCVRHGQKVTLKLIVHVCCFLMGLSCLCRGSDLELNLAPNFPPFPPPMLPLSIDITAVSPNPCELRKSSVTVSYTIMGMPPATSGWMEVRDKNGATVLDYVAMTPGELTNGTHTKPWGTKRNVPVEQGGEYVDPALSPYQIKLTITNGQVSPYDTINVGISVSQRKVESDWMYGQSGGGRSFEPDTSALPGALDDAYYSVTDHPDHDNNFPYHEYLTELGGDEQIEIWLDLYEDQSSADEYVLGANKYAPGSNVMGHTFSDRWCVTYLGSIEDWCGQNGPVLTTLRHVTAHEITSHQATLGSNDHCQWNQRDVCVTYNPTDNQSYDNMVLCGPTQQANPNNCTHKFRSTPPAP